MAGAAQLGPIKTLFRCSKCDQKFEYGYFTERARLNEQTTFCTNGACGTELTLPPTWENNKPRFPEHLPIKAEQRRYSFRCPSCQKVVLKAYAAPADKSAEAAGVCPNPPCKASLVFPALIENGRQLYQDGEVVLARVVGAGPTTRDRPKERPRLPVDGKNGLKPPLPPTEARPPVAAEAKSAEPQTATAEPLGVYIPKHLKELEDKLTQQSEQIHAVLEQLAGKSQALPELPADLTEQVARRLHQELLRPEHLASVYAAFRQLAEQLHVDQPSLLRLLANLPRAFDCVEEELAYWKQKPDNGDAPLRNEVVSTLEKVQARLHHWQTANQLERIPKSPQGDEFDWRLHTIAGTSPPASEPGQAGRIQRVERYGYCFGELPLRKAEVVVWDAAPSPPSQPEPRAEAPKEPEA